VFAVDTTSGAVLWAFQTNAHDIASGQVAGDTFVVSNNQGDAPDPVGEVNVIDRATGEPRWRFRAPSGLQVKEGPFRDGILYVNGLNDGLYALRDDGSKYTELWHVDAPESHWPMALVGDALYVVRTNGSVAAHSAADGSLMWETPAEGSWAGGPVVSGGMVFVANDTNGVMAFADPELIAQLPQASAQPRASATAVAQASSSPTASFNIVRSFAWADTGLSTPLGMAAGPDGRLYVLDVKPSVTVIDPSDGHVVTSWGRQGAGPGEFDVRRPDDNAGNGDVAVAPDGRVYVADGSNHRVQVFEPDGNFLFQFGRFGTDEGQFGAISEIEVGADGSVYVVDGPLSKFTADGKFVWRAEGLFGITIRRDGAILGTCEGCGEIRVIDPADGRVSDRLPWPGYGFAFGQMSTDPSGRLLVWSYGPQGELILDPEGNLIAAVEQVGKVVLAKTIDYAGFFWPSPVYTPDGRGYAFARDGLVELTFDLQ
jgi:outer membrane protein assembly factor BamB